jgi:hypothetical protein
MAFIYLDGLKVGSYSQLKGIDVIWRNPLFVLTLSVLGYHFRQAGLMKTQLFGD